MNKVSIGKDEHGKSLDINVARLIETRALIQANSGGGKSYAIRKLLEETHGSVQQIVLDMEGEFATLREKYDYLLAGKNGDIPAEPKSAELLARKTLELEFSLIVDLYELKQNDRILFVKNFIDAIVNSPKELWHPVLIVIDEAHVFVPEKGESQAASAVIDLATRGRKRGFCAVLATQRLSKLNKDVAAECLNKLIGRTSLDIDRKRAADELGFTTQNASFALRNLKPGMFYGFGPAISDEVTLAAIGEVSTTHPKAGHRIGARKTAPTEKIQKMLKQLADLPKEAAEEIRDRETLKAKVRELEREIKSGSKPDPKAEQKAYDQGLIEGRKESAGQLKRHCALIGRAYELANKLNHLLESTPDAPRSPVSYSANRAPSHCAPPVPTAPTEIDGRTFGQCERKILGFLKAKEGTSFSKVQIGAMTGYSHGSGGFNNAISKLTQAGLVVRAGSGLQLNPNANGQVEEIVGNETPHQLQDWINKLGACERKIYEMLLADPYVVFQKEAIAEVTGYSAGSGGFNNSISRLNTLGLIERNRDGISLNPEVREL